MAPTSCSQATLPGLPQEGTRDLGVSHLRDRLAVLNQGLSLTRPEALDIAAEMHAALHDSLHGCMSNLGAHRAPDKWRKAITATDRGVTLVDVAYLASLPSAEPRAAVRALVAVLEEHVGERAPVGGTVASRMADLLTATSAASDEFMRDFADGNLDDIERRRIHAKLLTAKSAIVAALDRLESAK